MSHLRTLGSHRKSSINDDRKSPGGCGDECPYVPGLRRDDWPLDDPRGKPIERVRAIRDDIRARVELLIAQEDVQ